jgi:hypothetical protein
MAQDEKQEKNVGNLGDVLKHVSLVAILSGEILPGSHTLYVETHAFRPEAEIGRKGWEVPFSGHDFGHAGKIYQDIEKPFTDAGRYLCSTGIAKRLLLAPRHVKADFVLCEMSLSSRSLIRQEFPDALVLQDNKDLVGALSSTKTRYDFVLAVIDPYTFDEISDSLVEWLILLSNVGKRDASLIALVFSYSILGVEWPQCSQTGLALSAELNAAPYCLALYSNSRGASQCLPKLKRLGWKTKYGESSPALSAGES